MITNERQCLIMQAQAAKFREAQAAVPAQGLHPKAFKAMHGGAQSQLAQQEEQLAEYEALRAGSADTKSAPNCVGGKSRCRIDWYRA